jgi:preprotein translocase subunit SecG
MLYYLLVGVYLLVCLMLLLVVLMQQGKGGDMASAFGGGGSSQTAFGARAGATVLTRATSILGALFMLGAIILGVYGSRGPGSVLSGVRAPAQAPAAPAPVAPKQPK